jgi:hypothetical protein
MEASLADFFSYVPVGDLDGHHAAVTLLKSADTLAALLADTTFDPDQTGTRNAANVTDLGDRKQVTNTKTNDVVSAAVCRVR